MTAGLNTRPPVSRRLALLETAVPREILDRRYATRASRPYPYPALKGRAKIITAATRRGLGGTGFPALKYGLESYRRYAASTQAVGIQEEKMSASEKPTRTEVENALKAAGIS